MMTRLTTARTFLYLRSSHYLPVSAGKGKATTTAAAAGGGVGGVVSWLAQTVHRGLNTGLYTGEYTLPPPLSLFLCSNADKL